MNMKDHFGATFVFTVIASFLAAFLAILFNIGSGNWSIDFWKNTFFWIAPFTFSFLLGMNSEVDYLERNGFNRNGDSCLLTSLVYGSIILCTSLIRDINRGSEKWFRQTLVWFLASIIGFFMGMLAVKLLSFMFKPKKTIRRETENVANSENESSFSFVSYFQNIADKLDFKDDELVVAEEATEEPEGTDEPEGTVSTALVKKETTVAEAAARFPEVSEFPPIIIISREEENYWFSQNEQND